MILGHSLGLEQIRKYFSFWDILLTKIDYTDTHRHTDTTEHIISRRAVAERYLRVHCSLAIMYTPTTSAPVERIFNKWIDHAATSDTYVWRELLNLNSGVLERQQRPISYRSLLPNFMAYVKQVLNTLTCFMPFLCRFCGVFILCSANSMNYLNNKLNFYNRNRNYKFYDTSICLYTITQADCMRKMSTTWFVM